jgi:hypothetical protein
MVFHHQIQSLTPAEAQELVDDLRANGTIEIHLGSLESLSPEVAAIIGSYRGVLELDGLTALCADSARGLVRFLGPVSLKGLTTLDDETAKVLAQHGHIDVIPGVEALIRPHRTADQQAQKDANDQKASEFTSGLAAALMRGLTARTKVRESQTCVSCGAPATEFKDETSKREYAFSLLCQACQDEVFGDESEDDEGPYEL